MSLAKGSWKFGQPRFIDDGEDALYVEFPDRTVKYVPERTCKPIDPFDKETKHIVERGLSHYYWPYKGCPECQRDFPQGSNYCPNCGAKVAD